MATYKVPQNVEADDKLLGPFSFRQFIYLMIAASGIFVAWLLSRIFILLAFIPLPVIFFFAILALPIKKDQPMETYLAALVSFYLKPRKRLWMPGQRESTILITAPKQVEPDRTRNISQEEALNRLSFLSNIVDTEGYAIKNASAPIREEYITEASTVPDILDNNLSNNINQIINKEQTTRHNELLNQMRTAIERADSFQTLYEQQSNNTTAANPSIINPTPAPISPVIIQPTITPPSPETPPPLNQPIPTPTSQAISQNISSTTQSTPQNTSNQIKSSTPSKAPTAAVINLANNKDYSIQTIQKEANRLKDQEEVYISLH